MIAGMEGLENHKDLAMEGRVNTGTIIRDRKLVKVSPLGDPDGDAGIRAIAMDNGIADQIGKHLLKQQLRRFKSG